MLKRFLEPKVNMMKSIMNRWQPILFLSLVVLTTRIDNRVYCQDLIAPDEKISMVWDLISDPSDNMGFEDRIAEVSGINVVSPTWFDLSSNEGNIDSTGDISYVEAAHSRGLEVWPSFTDFSSEVDTSIFLSSDSSVESSISKLEELSSCLGIDGICLDFEYFSEKDADNFISFIKALNKSCTNNSLTFSVCTVPPYDFNAYLNRSIIAEHSNYIINLGYEEHYVGSNAGSVASLDFEESAIKTLLGMGIPSEKIISAMPFYTRIWYTSKDDFGTTHTNSEELSMKSVNSTIASWELEPIWDTRTCQNYVEWLTDDEVLCQIWIEDTESLKLKADLISKYRLGGGAFWCLGFETPNIWAVIDDSLKTPSDNLNPGGVETENIVEDAFLFRGYEWGTAKPEIVESETNPNMIEDYDYTLIDGSFRVQVSLAGFDAIAVFMFDDIGLNSGAYFLTEEHSNPQEYYNDFLKLKEKYENKYGKPGDGGPTWTGTSNYKNNENSYGEAISQGYLSFDYHWYAKDNSVISMRISGDNGEVKTAIAYYSPEYIPEPQTGQVDEDDGI